MHLKGENRSNEKEKDVVEHSSSDRDDLICFRMFALYKRRLDLLVGGFQFEKNGTQSVIAAGDGYSRLPDPIVEVEVPGSIG